MYKRLCGAHTVAETEPLSHISYSRCSVIHTGVPQPPLYRHSLQNSDYIPERVRVQSTPSYIQRKDLLRQDS